MTTPFLLTKSPKSVGIAILLTLLFGPIGLFYASVTGGLIMTFTPIFLLLIVVVGSSQSNFVPEGWSLGLLIVFPLTYWLTNIIWAVISVNNYNRELEDDAKRQFELWNRLHENDQNQSEIIINQKSPALKSSGQEAIGSAKQNLQEWLRNNPGKTLNDYYSKFGS